MSLRAVTVGNFFVTFFTVIITLKNFLIVDNLMKTADHYNKKLMDGKQGKVFC
jgi:hypothetical protein